MTSRSADEVKAEFIQSFPAKTGELACELSWSITHLHLKWKNYRALFGTSPERIDLLNHAAPGFFGQLDPIMRHDVVLAITRLMDPPRTGRHKNASLGGLIELLAPHVGAAELAGWQPEPAPLNAAAKPRRALRDRFVAHEDLATALNYPLSRCPASVVRTWRHCSNVFAACSIRSRRSSSARTPRTS